MHAILTLICGCISAYHLAVGNFAAAAMFSALSVTNLALVYVEQTEEKSSQSAPD